MLDQVDDLPKMTSPTSTNSSMSSHQRFGLNEGNKNKILVYQHPESLITTSETELCKLVDSDNNLRVSKMKIPWGNSQVEVHQRDLFTEDERKEYADKANFDLSLAGIRLGRLRQLERMLGRFPELYIVSHKSPPSSRCQSKRSSPNSTFDTPSPKP